MNIHDIHYDHYHQDGECLWCTKKGQALLELKEIRVILDYYAGMVFQAILI